MLSKDVFAHQILALYRDDVREFLVDSDVPTIGSLDQNAELLDRAIAQTGELKIGFVGESQVGKSTLVNALLGRRALPSGGIGPLTAQATRVVYAEENGLTATYHGKQQVHRHAFAIARLLERRGVIKTKKKSHGELPDSTTGADELEGSASRLLDALDATDDGTSKKDELGRYMINQARRILQHDNIDAKDIQPSDVLLLDGLRAILDQSPIGDKSDLLPFQKRIAEVRSILGSTEDVSETTESSATNFNRALRLRAAGWRSPLVKELSLRLKAGVLQSLTLVDLPGIGVLNDPAGQEAERFVRTEGDALVIVFRNSGVTESVADLLERTGVITKLLFGGTADIPPIQVVLVVTHLDDVARDHYATQAQEARDVGESPPDRHRLFRELSEEMIAKIREMIGDALHRSKSFEDLAGEQKAAREKAVATLIKSMKIFCAASPDYLCLAVDGEDHGFLRNEEATNIPDIRRHLTSLANSAADRRSQTIKQFTTALQSSMQDHLAAIAQMYEEGRGAATQEFERFRDALTAAAEPLRHEMRAYHGEALGMLRKGMQSELQLVTKNAEIAALKKLQRATAEGAGLPYASVKAALMRNGVWERRGVNYPDAITLAFVDSIAMQWEPKIIEKVREEVRTLASRDLRLVEKLCSAARSANERIASETPMEAQRRILEAQSKTAVAWTKEQLDELRDVISTNLRETVQGPIDKACARAIRAKAYQDRGARQRILDAFAEGGEAAIQEARDKTEKLLKHHYNALLKKLNEGFLKDNHDPVQAALDTFTGEQISKARRSDAQRKRIVSAKVAAFAAKIAFSAKSEDTQPEARWQHANA